MHQHLIKQMHPSPPAPIMSPVRARPCVAVFWRYCQIVNPVVAARLDATGGSSRHRSSSWFRDWRWHDPAAGRNQIWEPAPPPFYGNTMDPSSTPAAAATADQHPILEAGAATLRMLPIGWSRLRALHRHLLVGAPGGRPQRRQPVDGCRQLQAPLVVLRQQQHEQSFVTQAAAYVPAGTRQLDASLLTKAQPAWRLQTAGCNAHPRTPSLLPATRGCSPKPCQGILWPTQSVTN